MDNQELIDKFHRQERNKKIVAQYFQYLTENRWDAIERMWQEIPPHILTIEALKQAADRVNLSDPEWLHLRSEEFEVHERFTERRKVLDQGYHKYKQPYPKAALSNFEEIYAQPRLQIINDIVDIIRFQNKDKSFRIIHMIAEDNLVLCTMLVKDKDPKSDQFIEYPQHVYVILEDGHIVRDIGVPHILSQLIQLGKITTESNAEIAQNYIESLRTIGIIS